jgi:hypothetical protein
MVMMVTSSACTLHSVEINKNNQPNKHWNLYITQALLCINSSACKAYPSWFYMLTGDQCFITNLQ